MKYYNTTLLFLLLSLCSFAQVPSYSVPVYDSTASKGYYFLGPTASGLSSIAKQNLILDAKGNVVYYQPFRKGQVAYDFKIQPNGLMSYWSNNKFYIMDSTFKIIDTVSCANGYSTDIHELQILANGNYLLLGQETVLMDLSAYAMFKGNGTLGSDSAMVICNVIQELDKSKKVVFEWHAKDHFSFDDVDEFFLSGPKSVDWTHSNALAQDTDGNILMSSRHFDEITKISHSTGDIIWRFGGKKNQFTFIGDSTPFYGQHDIRRIANGNITFYDDGNHDTPHGARGVEYQIDEVNKTAKLVWSYTYDPDMFAYATGNTQRLSNGNTLVNFGLINKNKVAFAVVTPSNKKVFELDFDYGVFTYRAFNYLSLPWQLQRPQIKRIDSLGVTYLVADSGYTSYLWSNGNTSRIQAIKDKGSYFVYVPYGEGFITSEGIDVKDNPCRVLAAISGPQKACAMTNVIYVAARPLASLNYYWKVSGGSIIGGQGQDSLYVKWNNDSNGIVTLIESTIAGCVDSDVRYVSIAPQPAAAVKGPVGFCANTTPVFEAVTHTGSGYMWKTNGKTVAGSLNQTQISPVWTIPGLGNVTLIETSVNGCVDSVTKTVNVYKVPDVTITGPDKVCQSGSAQYMTTMDSGGAFYSWAVTGGSITGNKNSNMINIAWGKSGAGSISLIKLNAAGCNDSSTTGVVINEPPRASFKVSNVCLGQKTSFIDSSSTETVDYNWDFGDGNGSAVDNPFYTYNTAGTYNVKLRVVTSEGCSDSTKGKVTVFPLPVANWKVTSNTGRQFGFKATDSTEANYTWNFGDGTAASVYSSNHLYSADGTYDVKLSVNSAHGCQSSFDSGLVVKTSSIIGTSVAAGQVSIFPNPSAQNINIQYTLPTASRVNISVYDMQGREIAPLTDVDQNAGSYTCQLDAGAHNIQSGMYMLRITIGDQIISKQIVLTR